MELDEDIAITNEVMATHDLEGHNKGFDDDQDFVLDFAENIFNFNTEESTQGTEEDNEDMQITAEKSIPVKKIMLMPQHQFIQKELSHQIKQLSFEIACKSLSNDDCHVAVIYILNMLSAYNWETKVVMMFAALGLIHGEFVIVSQQCHKKRLANKIAKLKQKLILSPSIIKSIVDLTKCMTELNESSSSSSSSPPQSLLLGTYWIARSVLTCAHKTSNRKSKHEIREQSNLIIAKIKSILSTCYPLLEEKRIEKSYEALLHAFSHSSNNLEVLKLIFNVEDGNDNFLHYSSGRSDVHFLENQRLLLMITSNTNASEIAFLSNRLWFITRVTIIWIPIIDDLELWMKENIQSRFSNNIMYGVRVFEVSNPQERITPQFIRFVKEKCFPAFQNGGEPIFISLDNHGRLVHTNALPMIMTWCDKFRTSPVLRGDNIINSLERDMREMTSSAGVEYIIDDVNSRVSEFVIDIGNKINNWIDGMNADMSKMIDSYNYTSHKEKALWNEETWSLNLLLSKYYYTSRIDDWIDEGYYIFLYGGNDTICIQEFIAKVKEVRSKSQLIMRMAYIGKSMKVRSEVHGISDYALGTFHCVTFWTRLRNMFMSRINYLNMVDPDERGDEVTKGLQKLLAYEAKGTTVRGWALLCKGEEVVVCDTVDKMLRVMNEYENWKDDVHNKDFSQAFKDCYDKLASSSSSSQHCHPCCALKYPSTLDKIPEDVKCPQCSRNMHKFVTFTCWHDVEYQTTEDY